MNDDRNYAKRPPPITGDSSLRSAKRKEAEQAKRVQLLAEIEAEFGPQIRSTRAAISKTWGTSWNARSN